MLVAMTFNVGLFIAIVLGEAIGYFLFDVNDKLDSVKGKYEQATDHRSSTSDDVPVLHLDGTCC
jgi:Ctr copper transporter family